MHVERLQALSTALKNYEETKKRLVLPEGKDWRKFKWDLSTFGKMEPSCSTAACAVGIACMLPEFREQGLSYIIVPQGALGDRIEPRYMCEYDGFSVAAYFFDIPQSVANYLFDPRWYAPRRDEQGYWRAVRPDEVAENIDRYLASPAPDTFVSDMVFRESEWEPWWSPVRGSNPRTAF